MNLAPNLEDVKRYWHENPVHSIEFSQTCEASEKDLRAYFDFIDATRWSENERWAEPNFYGFGIDGKARILDAGCGIGVFTRYYARKGLDVTAVDIAPSAVAMTRRSLELFHLEGKVEQASVENLPFTANTFDFVVSNGVIHHTPNTEAAVAELHRVLKPGGKASVCVYYRNLLLREPLWPLVRAALPLFLKAAPGRENLVAAPSPEDFVKAYDGNSTPIARVYSRAQADHLFAPFRILRREPHYFPARFLKFLRVGGPVHWALDRTFGCLIYYLLQKA